MTGLDRLRLRIRIGLAVFYGAAGVLHILFPAPFVSITPAWVPDAPLVIFATGLCELAGAAGLFLPRLRTLACAALALYAVCVFPANIKHAMDSLSRPDATSLAWAYHLVRLPLQPLLVWLPLFSGNLVTWPLRRRAARTE